MEFLGNDSRKYEEEYEDLLAKYNDEQKKSFKNKLQNNLRYTIGDIIVTLYGKYNKENEQKFSELLNINAKILSNLTQNGKIDRVNFERLCDFLKLDNELKEIWTKMYVTNDMKERCNEQVKTEQY